MLTEQEEKRRFPRIDLRVPLRVQVLGQPRFDNTITDNVSAGGVGFTAEEFMPTETPLMLEFNIFSRLIRCIGKVVWSAPLAHSNKNRIGVELAEINPECKQFLADYLTMQIKQ